MNDKTQLQQLGNHYRETVIDGEVTRLTDENALMRDQMQAMQATIDEYRKFLAERDERLKEAIKIMDDAISEGVIDIYAVCRFEESIEPFPEQANPTILQDAHGNKWEQPTLID